MVLHILFCWPLPYLPKILQQQQQVYALDLVGFGDSDKPVMQYTIELWAALLVDFMAEFCSGTPALLVGNSIGSLAVLAAAADAPQASLAGLVLLNSAGAMNNKGVVADWRIIAAWPLLMLIDAALRTRPLAAALFRGLAKPDTIRKVLGGVYGDQAAVDDELVDIILAPADAPTALDVFVSVITGM
jgi:pimeloyl-ACP methyl ester carboxylesterase